MGGRSRRGRDLAPPPAAVDPCPPPRRGPLPPHDGTNPPPSRPEHHALLELRAGAAGRRRHGGLEAPRHQVALDPPARRPLLRRQPPLDALAPRALRDGDSLPRSEHRRSPHPSETRLPSEPPRGRPPLESPHLRFLPRGAEPLDPALPRGPRAPRRPPLGIRRPLLPPVRPALAQAPRSDPPLIPPWTLSG